MRFSTLVALAVVAVAGGAAAVSDSGCSTPCDSAGDCAPMYDLMDAYGGDTQCAAPGQCALVTSRECSSLSLGGDVSGQDAWTWSEFADGDHAWTCAGCFSSCGSLSRDWQAVPGTTLLVRTSDDAALLTGTLRNKDDHSTQLDITVELAGHIFVAAGGSGAPAGSPKGPRAGGPSVNDYHYWTEGAVTIRGLTGTVAGLDVSFSRAGPSFQLAVGGNDKNSNLGASMWMDVEDVASQPGSGSCSFVGGSTIDLNLNLNQACVLTRECDQPPVLPPPVRQCLASRAIPSPDTCTRGGGHALTLGGIGRLLFKDGSGRWSEAADGTAAITGVVTTSINGKEADFDAYYILGRRIKEPQLCTPGQPDTVPETGAGYCMAKRELFNSKSDTTIGGCYSEAGGPVDVSTWDMYLEVIDGQLRGIAGTATEGYILELKMRGPGLQIGTGAGGKSIEYSAAGWVSWKTTSTGSGLATLDGQTSSYKNGDWNIKVECAPTEPPLVPCSDCDHYQVPCGCQTPDSIWSMANCATVEFVPADETASCAPVKLPCFGPAGL